MTTARASWRRETASRNRFGMRLLGVAAWVLVGLVVGCGAREPLMPAGPQTEASEGWPEVAAPPADTLDVAAALASPDGSQVVVRAVLVAVTVPCPACRASERTGARAEPQAGKSARRRESSVPGCLPCPSPAATFRDAAEVPASGSPLRAVGVAEGLQPRHTGKIFLLTGVIHAGGSFGPEIDVTDVRAVEDRSLPSPKP